MEFSLFDSGMMLLIAPRAIVSAEESEQKYRETDIYAAKTVIIYTTLGTSRVVSDKDRTVMARIRQVLGRESAEVQP